MQEILSESIRLVNLPFTVLLGGLVCYWLLVAIGLLHFDSGADADLQVGGEGDLSVGGEGDLAVGGEADLAVGGDAHVDAVTDAAVDAGADVAADAGADSAAGGEGTDTGDHSHAGSGHGPGLLSSVMKFVHLGDVPAMIVVSVQALCMWLFSMIANHYWNDHSLTRAAVFLLPNLLVSAIITRYVTWPLARFFRALNREYAEHQSLIGRTCRITTSEVTDRFGQAEMPTRGAPLVLQVRTSAAEPLRRGDTALVIRHDKDSHTYHVRKITPENLET